MTGLAGVVLLSLSVPVSVASPPEPTQAPTARPVSVVVQQVRQEWTDERAADAIERFIVFGDTSGLHDAIAIDPWAGESVTLSRESHWASETVTVDGVLQSATSGSRQQWSVVATDTSGAPVVTTREVSTGTMPVIVDTLAED